MNKKVILAIDDEPLALKLLGTQLSFRYQLETAVSAAEAEKRLTQLDVDLILLDIEMPGVSGFEFLHEIRKDPKHMNTPIIIVTGHSEPEFLDHAKNSSAADILLKPVNQQILEATIERVLSSPPKNPFKF